MGTDLTNTMQRIGEKSRFLVERYRVLDKENKAARQRVAELQKALTESKKEIEQLRMQVEYLTISSALSPDRKAISDTRAIIANLVREVDRCIADLND